MNIISKLFIGFVALAVSVSLCGCSQTEIVKNTIEDISYKSQSYAMNTFINQQIFSADKDKSESVMKSVDEMVNKIENNLSAYKSDSDISKINDTAGMTEIQRPELSAETMQVVKESIKMCKNSRYGFDITIGALTKLWNVSDRTDIPDGNLIESAKNTVNYKNIVVDNKNRNIWLSKEFMSIDLGGIAKGYVCDKIKEKYQQEGITSALVQVGGSIVTIGNKSDGTDFSIGIRDPFGGENDICAAFSCSDKFISTTGKYERYFEKDGVRYHHIIDKNTGFPVDNDIESVTIVADSGIYADYLSTPAGSLCCWTHILFYKRLPL